MRTRPALIVAALALAWSSAARAQDARAEELFQAAQSLMSQGNFEQACPKFAASHKIEPGIGVMLYWADCLEKAGHLAGAWAKFEDAARSARVVGQADREAQARERAAALAPRLARVTVAPTPGALAIQGLTIRRDGIELASTMFREPVPVDPGQHVVEASAPGHETFRAAVDVASAAVVMVEIPPLVPSAGAAPAPAAHASPGAPPEESPSSFGGQRTAALVVGGLGVGGLIVGTLFGVQTFSSWSDAEEDCERVSSEEALQCGDDGSAAADDARTQGAISTIGFAVGGAALAGAVVLWLTAPEGPERAASRGSPPVASRVIPLVGPTFGGAAMTGNF